MAVLIRPRRQVQKPFLGARLDSGHPIATGLVGAWLFNEMGGAKVVNLAAQPPIDGALVSDYSWIQGSAGFVGRPEQGSGLLMGTNRGTLGRTNFGDIRITNDMTVMCSYRPLRTPSASDVAVVGKWNSGGAGGTNEWTLLQSDSGSDLKHGFILEVGSTRAEAEITGWNLSQIYNLVGVRRGTGLEFYRDGSLQASITGPSGAINTGTGRTLKLGELDVTAGFNTNALYYNVYLWNRALSPGEIAWLAAEPYVFFTPSSPRQRYWVAGPAPVAASGTASLSLSASGGASAQAAGTGSLTLVGSGTASAPVTGTGSLALTASGAAKAAAQGIAALTLAAAGAATASPTGTAALTLVGTGTTAALATGTGSLTLAASGTGQAPTGGTGTLSLLATGAARGLASGTASIALTAAGAASALTSGLATLTLAATGTARATVLRVLTFTHGPAATRWLSGHPATHWLSSNPLTRWAARTPEDSA